DAKEGPAGLGGLYRVEDVMNRNGILETRAGRQLTPVGQPAIPLRSNNNEPEVEPTPLQPPDLPPP
ncbi:MAG: hypothetical protein ACJ8JD_12145, partial [Chthoniobacterales bacterium]